jgi:hypothetical protein
MIAADYAGGAEEVLVGAATVEAWIEDRWCKAVNGRGLIEDRCGAGGCGWLGRRRSRPIEDWCCGWCCRGATVEVTEPTGQGR